MLEFKRHNDILAIKTEEGHLIGFHARNLEVASLSPEIWSSALLNNQPSSQSSHQDLDELCRKVEGNTDREAEMAAALAEWDAEEFAGDKNLDKPVPKFNSFTINVTQVCNLHCQYCAAGGDGSYGDPIKKISVEKTLPQLKYFVEKLAAGETLKINFVGGEPLLYPDGIEILFDYLQVLCSQKDLILRTKVVTNGTQFTERNLELLAKIRPYLVVSLDGPPEINDLRRPNKGQRGVTQEVLKGLEKLRNIKTELAHLEVSGVFGPGNLDLLNASEFYQSLGVDSMDFTFDHHAHDLESSQEFIHAYHQLTAQLFAQGGESALRRVTAMDAYFHQLDEQKRVENFCGAGKSFLVIDAKNNLYTCPWESGQAAEMVGSQTSLFTEKLKQYQAPLIEKPDCRQCWAKYLCGGGCMYIHKNSTGFKNKVDEMFCFRQRNLISIALIYYERSRNYKELTNATH